MEHQGKIRGNYHKGNALENKDQIDLIDIYRIFHPKKADYTFLPSAHRTSSRIDFMLTTKQISTNLRGQKLYQAVFPTITVWN